tara:strand:- start:653 stop:838 length:186 start_codon:yes stop_codon:yes gene_type:complete
MSLHPVKIYSSLSDCLNKKPKRVIEGDELSTMLWTKKSPFNNGKRKQPIHKNNNHLFVPQA